MPRIIGFMVVSSPLVQPQAFIDPSSRAACRFVDCRFSLVAPALGGKTYLDGHIPGAVYAHLDRHLSGEIIPGTTGRHPLPSPEILAVSLGGWGIGNDDHVVAYDDQGSPFAARLWWLLRWLGHDRISVLDGGYSAWKAAGLPTTTKIAQVAPKEFSFHLRPELVADRAVVAEVSQALQIDSSSGLGLLDARNRSRFVGEPSAFDAVAGHIPGARCLPWEDLVDHQCFRSPEVLKLAIDDALGGAAPRRTIAYCGSGVTACHLLLGAELAGTPGMRLYPGSWSEWIIDPNAPISTE